MDIHLTVRSDEVKTAARDYLKEKLHKLDKMHLNIVDAHAVLDVQKYRNMVEVTLSGKNLRIAAKEEDRDMITAVDKVLLKLNHQVLKHKEILKQKKGGESRKFGEETGEETIEETGEEATETETP